MSGVRILAAVLMSSALIACGTSAISPKNSASLVERSRVSMGSELHLTAWTSDAAAAADAFEAVFAEFDRLDALMSVWREGSEIVRLNAAAGVAPVPVSREVRDVLLDAHRISEWTGGKFDVTFGALSGLWKFDHDQDGIVPSRADVLAKLPLIDYEQLVVDEAASTAFLKQKGMRAHLGGIGKGYAVDSGVAILRERAAPHQGAVTAVQPGATPCMTSTIPARLAALSAIPTTVPTALPLATPQAPVETSSWSSRIRFPPLAAAIPGR